MPRRKTTAATVAVPAKRTRKTGANNRKTVQPNYDESRIQARAYEIYLKRSNGSGTPLGDWLQAERELKKSLKT